MCGDEHDGDIGPHPDMCDADQRCDCQVERRRRLDARDTIALCEGVSLGQHRQIDGRNAQRDLGLHDLKRLSINLDERGSQRFVPLDNLKEGLFDQFSRQVALDAPPHRDVQGRIAGFELVQQPEALLRQGGRILNAMPRFDRGLDVRPFCVRANVVHRAVLSFGRDFTLLCALSRQAETGVAMGSRAIP